MNRNTLLFALSVSLIACDPPTEEKKENPAFMLEYPVTAKEDQVDNYFGTDVPDPYRWLEDDRFKESAEWVQA